MVPIGQDQDSIEQQEKESVKTFQSGATKDGPAEGTF